MAAIMLGDGIEPERSGQFLCSLSFHHEGVSGLRAQEAAGWYHSRER